MSWIFLFNGTTSDYTEYLEAIECPVLIVWGTEDALFAKKDQDDVRERLTNARKVEFVAIEGASHGVFTDSRVRADEIANLVSGFIG